MADRAATSGEGGTCPTQSTDAGRFPAAVSGFGDWRACIVSSWFAPEMVQGRRMWPDILQIITDEWEQAQAERGAE